MEVLGVADERLDLFLGGGRRGIDQSPDPEVGEDDPRACAVLVVDQDVTRL